MLLKIESTNDAYIEITAANIEHDINGDEWREVTLPYNDRGELHPISQFYNARHNDLKTGWVPLDSVKEISAYDWPGFYVMDVSNNPDKGGLFDADHEQDNQWHIEQRHFRLLHLHGF